MRFSAYGLYMITTEYFKLFICDECRLCGFPPESAISWAMITVPLNSPSVKDSHCGVASIQTVDPTA